MKKLSLIFTLFFMCLNLQAAPDFDHSTKMVKATIKKVYHFQEEGYSNTSYLISYKGRDVVAMATPMGKKGKVLKTGDKVSLMVQKINMPEHKIRMIQFMIMPELSAMMEEQMNKQFEDQSSSEEAPVETSETDELPVY